MPPVHVHLRWEITPWRMNKTLKQRPSLRQLYPMTRWPSNVCHDQTSDTTNARNLDYCRSTLIPGPLCRDLCMPGMMPMIHELSRELQLLQLLVIDGHMGAPQRSRSLSQHCGCWTLKGLTTPHDQIWTDVLFMSQTPVMGPCICKLLATA